MKYLVIGAGGTGASISAYMTKAGKDVTLLARGEHLEMLKKHGLRVETSWMGDYTVPVRALHSSEYTEKADVIFVCVKGYSLESIIPIIEKAAHKDTIVIPILNIYGTGRVLQARLPELLVTDGCIYIAANKKEPGVLSLHGTIFRVVYGVPEHTTDHPVLMKVKRDLDESGIMGIYSDNIEKDALEKFSYVSPMAACGQYYGAKAKEMQQPGEIRDLFTQLVSEVQKLAEAMGIFYDADLTDVNLKILDNLAPTASTSMQRDIEAGNPSEIDGLVFEVVRLAEKYGVDVPGYQMVSNKLAAL